MPFSITLSDLSYATPEGRILFEKLDHVFAAERTGLVGRNGVGKTTLFKLIDGRLKPSGGSIDVAGKIAVFDQAVSVDPEETIADLFGMTAMLASIDLAERGLADANALADIDWTAEERALSALAETGLAASLDTLLAHLSGGEVTRARLAALAFSRADFILLDEPTNNLDRDGREALRAFLRNWRGGALIISHDRSLLDDMDAIVELTSKGGSRYGGNFSFYEAEKAAERLVVEHELRDAQKDARKAVRIVAERAERKAKRDAKGRRLRDSGSQSKMLLDKMKAGAEAAGARDRALSRRQQDVAADALDKVRAKAEVVAPFTLVLSPSELAAGRRVARVEKLSVGYAERQRLFSGLSFEMTGPERVAITGRNGAGKSSLVAALTGKLAPLAGRADICVSSALFDQSTSLLDPDETVRANFLRLNPEEDENACRAVLARFRFRADAALRLVGTLSGGERLRAGLAAAIGGKRPAELLILDEPTNHLDLESLATLEAGLNAYDGAILVISHDPTFLERIGVSRTIDLGAKT